MRQIRIVVVILALTAVTVSAAVALASSPVYSGGATGTSVQTARATFCPDIYAPVKCNGGKVYVNQCQACCAGATNCVPLGLDPM